MKPLENKMGVMPIGKLLWNMALPMALSMLVQALYNVVDSVFVSRISDVDNCALTAVSLAFPVQNIMIGVATGIAVGVNALLSRSLGAKDSEGVNRSALNGVFLALCGTLLFVLFGAFGAEIYMRSLTADPVTIAYGVDYVRVICIVSFGIFGEILFERLLQSTGRTAYTMLTQGVGAIINIILDPILIFGYFGLPRMEVMGAAVATVLGQIVAFVLAVVLNLKKNPDVQLVFRRFRPDGVMLRRILAIGVPSMVMIAIGSVMNYTFNLILDSYNTVQAGLGEAGKTVFGAYFKLQSFVFMPVFGINNAVLAICAYNYGARLPDRITRTIRCGALGAGCLMVIGIAVFQLLPGTLLDFFSPDDTMRAVGIPAPAQPALCLRGAVHHPRRRIPRTWQERLQHDRLHLPPARRPPARCLPAVARGGDRPRLALLPHRGGRLPDPLDLHDAPRLEAKDPAPAPRRAMKKRQRHCNTDPKN